MSSSLKFYILPTEGIWTLWDHTQSLQSRPIRKHLFPWGLSANGIGLWKSQQLYHPFLEMQPQKEARELTNQVPPARHSVAYTKRMCQPLFNHQELCQLPLILGIVDTCLADSSIGSWCWKALGKGSVQDMNMLGSNRCHTDKEMKAARTK